MALLQGFEGTVTASGINVAKVKKWSADVKFKTVEEGPFIGSTGETEVVATTKTISGKLECVIPSGKDAGQTALITQAMALGTVALTLTETSGYTVTIATATIEGIAFDTSGDSSAKVSFDWRNNGSFTIA